MESVISVYAQSQHAVDALLERADDRGGRAELQDEVAVALEEFETEARTFLRDSALEPIVAARGLSTLRAWARVLRRVTRAVEGRPAWDETPFLLVELQDIETGLNPDRDPLAAEAALPPPPTEFGRRLSRTRLQAVWTHARNQLAAAARIPTCTGEDAARAYRLFRALDATHARLRARTEELTAEDVATLGVAIDRVASERDRLESEFFRFAAEVDGEADLEVLSEAALACVGELDEARLAGADARTREEVDELRRLERLGARIGRTYRAALRRVRPIEPESERVAVLGPRRVERRLRRMCSRIRALVADRVLALRLERIFGRRMVEVWEAIVFWLIIGVLVLIFVDHHRTPVEGEVLPWTVCVDTAICAILLLDFGTRLVLSPRRLDYLRRRFLTELVPSIPFGLIVSLEHVDAVRSVRALRLVRVFRVLQLVRPFVRLFRLLLFVARALDRLVERNAWFLNHNIVFFTDSVRDEEVPTLLKRARDLDAWITRSTSESLAGLPFDSRLEAAELRRRFVEVELAHDRSRGIEEIERLSPGRGRVKDLDVDDVIMTLRDLNSHRIAEYMGLEFARQVTSSLRILRLPVLRNLPVIRYLMGTSGAPDPLLVTARVGRLLGDLLAIMQRTITWFADLYGSITGAQFLDRVGTQLVKATAQPARRLVLFSLIVGIGLLFIQVLRLPFLETAANGLLRFLSLPVLVLGVVCIVPLVIGHWFRRIAGQAADFYDRVAEAQFLSLTETVKEGEAENYLRYLADRVILPEVRLEDDVDDVRLRDAARRFLTRGIADPLLTPPYEAEGQLRPVDGLPQCDAVLLYFRTFLDGSFFHANDTKVASLLLGNLTLENVRENRLRYDKKQRKRLEALDIGRGKGGVRGPYVWFNFITHSVAQLCARLVLEYNQHCIPSGELAVADPEDRELFQHWLERRLRLSRLRQSDVASQDLGTPSREGGTLLYRTTEFHVLHFLTVDPRRDAAVRARFGDLVHDLMKEDRENLIRTVFGTFPMQSLPKNRRTLNPYEFYRSYFARGRVFLFPFLLFCFGLKAVRLGFRHLVKIVKEVLDPDARPLQASTARAGFDVARRKIHRMRRPVVIEAVRLRAEFDVQYLGLALPGRELVGWEGNLLADDLRGLNASEREWHEFRELKSERQRRVRMLSELLRRRRRSGHDFEAEVVQRNPSLAGRERAALRAAVTAFVCDHHDAASILEAVFALEDALKRTAGTTVPAPRGIGVARRRRRLRPKVERALEILRAAGRTSGADGAGRIVDVILSEHRDLEAHVEVLLDRLPDGVIPDEYAYEVMLDAGEQPSSWNEQIVAVRTIQSLGMIDLLGYERLIQALGNYEMDASETGGHRRKPGVGRDSMLLVL